MRRGRPWRSSWWRPCKTWQDEALENVPHTLDAFGERPAEARGRRGDNQPVQQAHVRDQGVGGRGDPRAGRHSILVAFLHPPPARRRAALAPRSQALARILKAREADGSAVECDLGAVGVAEGSSRPVGVGAIGGLVAGRHSSVTAERRVARGSLRAVCWVAVERHVKPANAGRVVGLLVDAVAEGPVRREPVGDGLWKVVIGALARPSEGAGELLAREVFDVEPSYARAPRELPNRCAGPGPRRALRRFGIGSGGAILCSRRRLAVIGCRSTARDQKSAHEHAHACAHAYAHAQEATRRHVYLLADVRAHATSAVSASNGMGRCRR